MDHRIRVVCFEIESDTGSCLGINELSRIVNLSSSRLRHLFKAETGETLAQFRKRVRLGEAQVLLSTTFMSIKEIMHKVGVGSDSHFARDFKEASGLSPTQYRVRSQKSRSL